MIRGLGDKVEEAISLRLPQHLPAIVYLSGGLDSSTIAGFANKTALDRGQHLFCFTIGFAEESGFGECEIAKRTAEWLL